MGCDIHFFTEVKMNGKWYQYSAPSLGRWYGLFEKMAGVRGEDSNAISPPKGLPDDVNELTKRLYEYWSGDAHSASWLNCEEIAMLEKWLKAYYAENRPGEFFYPEKLWGYLNGNGYGDFKKHRSPSDFIEDARFVFWFDN